MARKVNTFAVENNASDSRLQYKRSFVIESNTRAATGHDCGGEGVCQLNVDNPCIKSDRD